jgi:hypothetical protein
MGKCYENSMMQFNFMMIDFEFKVVRRGKPNKFVYSGEDTDFGPFVIYQTNRCYVDYDIRTATEHDENRNILTYNVKNKKH